MSPKQIHALISEPGQDGFIVKWINADLQTLQSIVGGYIEAVSTEHCLLYCDEEGKLKGYKTNRAATRHIESLVPGFTDHDVLVGTTVWLGSSPVSGNSLDMPVIEIGRFARTLCSTEAPIGVIRSEGDIWVYDVTNPFVLAVRDIVQQARRDTESAVIEVYAGISPARWVELRTELLMDHHELRLHDKRSDRS